MFSWSVNALSSDGTVAISVERASGRIGWKCLAEHVVDGRRIHVYADVK